MFGFSSGDRCVHVRRTVVSKGKVVLKDSASVTAAVTAKIPEVKAG